MPFKRSSAFALAGVLLAAPLIAVPMQPSVAKENVRGPDTWGPMFKSQVERCWHKPAAVGAETGKMKVVLEISLTREGRLVEQPSVSPESSATASDYAQAYQKSALRALTECQPYTLPAEYYEQWKHFMPIFVELPAPPKEKGKPGTGLFDTRTPSICRGC